MSALLDTVNKFKELSKHGYQEVLAHLWNHFINQNEFFETLQQKEGYNWEYLIHIHPNTKEELLKAFDGDCKRLLDAMFSKHNEEGVSTYHMDAMWFITDGESFTMEDKVEDMVEHIITAWCNSTSDYNMLWIAFMEFAVRYYDIADAERQEEDAEEARLEREAKQDMNN